MGDQSARERLWASPHCLNPDDDDQLTLFETGRARPVVDTRPL